MKLPPEGDDRPSGLAEGASRGSHRLCQQAPSTPPALPRGGSDLGSLPSRESTGKRAGLRGDPRHIGGGQDECRRALLPVSVLPRKRTTGPGSRYSRSPCNPTSGPKGLQADLLLALGDPAWSSGTVQTLTNRAVKLLGDCGVELIVMDEFHHLFDADRAKVMTKASQWLKVLIVNTGIPVVVCGMPEAEFVLSAEHTERRFKERLTLRCFTWRTPQGQREFCAMLKKLDETLPLANLSGLAEPDLAGRFYLASRGVPDLPDDAGAGGRRRGDPAQKRSDRTGRPGPGLRA